MSTKNLAQLIFNYLKFPKTDYAILIDGEWGSGKTHFVRHTLIPYIDSMEYVDKDNGKKFKGIYISLYGLRDVQELREKIILEINPKYKKAITIGSGIFKKLLEGLTRLDLDKEINDLIGLYDIP